MAYCIGEGEIQAYYELKIKREQERQAGRNKGSRGGNQVDEKKGKTYTRRSSTGKKEERKACVLWCLHSNKV